ncbi:CLIP domain-containing serine protease B4-like [Convolutriloba macropyga]|uniref:CLIP domain-containing serine protease B4-like n=1 Tax=Convolutriloba macropyga TaxID=536237 RepID=UPI003F520CFD
MPYCGGTLITSKYILTAGHCLKDKDHIKVYLGDHSMMEKLHIDVQDVNKFEIHKDYSNDKKQSKYDIAIVKLNKEWKKSPSLRMCEPNENSGIRPLTVLGMGTTVPGLGKHKTPTYLQETFQEEVEAYPDKFCGKQPIPYEYEVCLRKWQTLNSSPCDGDSGSPAFIEDDLSGDAECLYGVLSGTKEDCDGSGSIYVKVSKMGDWIKETMKKLDSR